MKSYWAEISATQRVLVTLGIKGLDYRNGRFFQELISN